MRDEMDSRIWVEHHADFSDFLANVLDGLKVTFQRLHAIEFDAPWRRSSLDPAE